ncbi:MAG: OmpA family protein [Calditrichaeota bacterium]|nr:OmpA family protein [Calditrichota bacterium]
MSEYNEPPIIRIVKKGHGHGHHGGAWKVAFADFVTAMMALFIVLWILGQSEDVKRGVGGYFRDPTGKALLGAGPNQGMGGAQGKSIIRLPAVTQSFAMPDPALESEAEKLEELIAETEALQALEGQITIEVTHEGLRLEISEGDKEPLFESGSSDLSPELIRALQALTKEYKGLPNKLILEGHTDAAQFASGSDMTNWELSTQRANQARKIMEDSGLPQDQILMVRGFADRRPKFEDMMDARNRRISLLLVSNQGMDIALGKLSFTGMQDTETLNDQQADAAGVPKKGRISLFATGREETP